MMKAPSEKHLEDWIVENLGSLPSAWVAKFNNFKLVAQQMQFNVGVADLILIDKYQTLHIVELKKDKIDGKALAQILRYKSAMEWIAQEAYMKLYNAMADDIVEFDRLQDIDPNGNINCRLIGHSIDIKTLHACSSADVDVFIYDFDGTDYLFDHHHIIHFDDQIDSVKEVNHYHDIEDIFKMQFRTKARSK